MTTNTAEQSRTTIAGRKNTEYVDKLLQTSYTQKDSIAEKAGVEYGASALVSLSGFAQVYLYKNDVTQDQFGQFMKAFTDGTMLKEWNASESPENEKKGGERTEVRAEGKDREKPTAAEFINAQFAQAQRSVKTNELMKQLTQESSSNIETEERSNTPTLG